MKRTALTLCVFGLLQALTGCCSCCDVGAVSPCYSGCVPANTGYAVNDGCCGQEFDYSLPPSPYAYQQRGVRIRSRGRALPPAYGTYATDPYIQGGGTVVDDGSMYESFDSGTMQGDVMQGDTMQGEIIQGDPVYQSAPGNQSSPGNSGPGNSGWQPRTGNMVPSPAPVHDSGPTTFSAPTPIPRISTTPTSVPGPPTSGNPQYNPQYSGSSSGPNMGPMPPMIPDNVSQMGYRQQLPIYRAF